MNELKEIYYVFLKNYFLQKWWPVTPEGKVHPEYSGGPKNEKQKLEVIFGAILTQNTSWKNVEKAIVELNKRDLIDIDKILEIPRHELALTIKSSGYFNQKAIKLKAVAAFINNNPLAELEKLDILKLRKLLLVVKGIGPETADSIILYAFNKPSFVVDAYTKRIFSRVGLARKEAGYNEFQDLFQNNLEKDPQVYNEYHALIVEHAKRFCNKKPLCRECILRDLCKKVF